MPIRSYFLALCIIFLTSSISVGLLVFYMNPLSNPQLALSLFLLWVFMVCTSSLTALLFFAKKVYYRGDVNLSTMNASIRQWILLSIGILFIGILMLFQIQDIKIFLAWWATLGCIEVMIQAVE